MADWEEIGHRLTSNGPRLRPSLTRRSSRGWRSPSALSLISSARYTSTQGVNFSYLNNYLRSDRGLSPLDCELLAQVNEGVLDRKPERHRPKNKRAHGVALCARAFYRAWQEACKNAGISTWGLANPMKDEACNYALLLETDDEQPKFELCP